jgi:hypothetical protein
VSTRFSQHFPQVFPRFYRGSHLCLRSPFGEGYDLPAKGDLSWPGAPYVTGRGHFLRNRWNPQLGSRNDVFFGFFKPFWSHDMIQNWTSNGYIHINNMCIYIRIGYQEYDLALWKDGFGKLFQEKCGSTMSFWGVGENLWFTKGMGETGTEDRNWGVMGQSKGTLFADLGLAINR